MWFFGGFWLLPYLSQTSASFYHISSDSDLPAALFKDLGDFMGSAEVFQVNIHISSSLFNHI